MALWQIMFFDLFICVVESLNQAISDGVGRGLKSVLESEVESSLGTGVFNMIDYLTLDLADVSA